MDQAFTEAARRATDLVGEIRADRFDSVKIDGELLGLAALIRAAHLLEALAQGPRVVNDPLTALGFRDVLETTVNGLACLARPDDYGRWVREDLEARERIARHLGKGDEIAEFLAGYASFDDAPRQQTFGQRIELAATIDGVFADDDDVGRAKAMYAYLSNFQMHGGLGVLGDYIASGPGGRGVRPVPAPAGLIESVGALELAVGMVGQLHRIVRKRMGPA